MAIIVHRTCVRHIAIHDVGVLCGVAIGQMLTNDDVCVSELRMEGLTRSTSRPHGLFATIDLIIVLTPVLGILNFLSCMTLQFTGVIL